MAQLPNLIFATIKKDLNKNIICSNYRPIPILASINNLLNKKIKKGLLAFYYLWTSFLLPVSNAPVELFDEICKNFDKSETVTGLF